MRVNSAIPTHHKKNNSNNIKMILNPCNIDEAPSLNENQKQKNFEEGSNLLQHQLEIVINSGKLNHKKIYFFNFFNS